MGAKENCLQPVRHPHGMDPEYLADSTLLKPRTETFWCLHRSVARVRVCVSAFLWRLCIMRVLTRSRNGKGAWLRFCGYDASCRC